MKAIHKSLIALIATSVCCAAMAKPARPGYKTVTQPDGSTLTIHLVGNARMHFTLTDDDKIVIKDSNGQYSYANISDDGSFRSTGVQASSAATRSAAEAAVAVDIHNIDLTQHRNTVMRRSSSINGVGKATGSFPTKGDVKGIVILVNFQDLQFKDDSNYNTNARDYFSNMLSQDGFSEWNGTGSAREYFVEQSKGQFNPTFDVVGPYTVSKGYAYYGENNNWGWDKYPAKMVAEACKLADADVNFADYDNDGDGYCDYVYVIYAGYSESSNEGSDYIWPHSYHLSYTNDHVKLDGVTVDNYACSNEWEGNTPDGMGTFTHEFSHVMGLPDIYYTGSDDFLYCTPGKYDALDTGCYNNNARTIPAYSSYERNALGWIDLKELTEAENITLENLSDSNDACVIRTTNDNEFFLLENRQQNGWDKYIPHHGMLIWHIDFNQRVFDNNNVNNNESHQYVDIVEANNTHNNASKVEMKGWPWPGISGAKSFTSETTPAMIDWSGNAIDMPITEITEKDGLISFKVKGGTESGINDIISNDDDNSTPECFNLMGQRVTGNTPGIYIERTANGTRKVIRK